MLNIPNPFANPKVISGEVTKSPSHFLILGLGESGVAMAKWCLRNGAKVRLADTRDSQKFSDKQKTWLAELEQAGLKDVQWGPLTNNLLKEIDVIGISPGLSPTQEPIQSFIATARQDNVEVWSEIEFFARAIAALTLMQEGVANTPVVLVITGTNGKTTTTALTGQLCERAGKKVAVAGNISPAALDKLEMCLNEADQFSDMPDIWVLELSSFQLLFTDSLNATAATVLNITQDHLDWHGDMQSYANAKARIFGPDSICILNRDDPLAFNLLSEDEKLNRSIVTFGAGRPDEQGAFGIERDWYGLRLMRIKSQNLSVVVKQ